MSRYDGELADDGELNDDETAKLAGLEALGDALRDSASAAQDEVSADAFSSMWSQIEHKITANGAAAHAAAADTDDTRLEKPGANDDPGLIGAIAGWFERFRSQVAVGAVCAAVAAILVWFVRPPEKTVEYVEVAAPANGGARTVPVVLKSHAAEVESLEVYDGSGVVLTIPSDGDDDAPTTVIWLSPPENSVEGPI